MSWIIGTLLVFTIGFALVLLIMKIDQQRIKGTLAPSQTEDSGYAKLDGLQIHFVVKGEGPDLLLLHGLGANLICWRFLIDDLAKNFRVWAIDLPGFGKSDKPMDYSYGLQNQAITVARFLDFANVKQCLLVGNSMGAGIGAQFAISFPDRINGLVLLNSAHDPKIVGIWDIRKIKRLRHFIKPFIGRRFVKRALKHLYGTSVVPLTEDVIDAYLSPYLNDAGSAEAFIESFAAILENQHLVKNLQEYGGPIMILWGQRDRLVPIKFGHQLAQDLGVRDFYIHPEAGHHMQEEVPQWVSEKIREFNIKINS